SGAGVHDFAGTTPGYFSVDGGTTPVNTFNTITGADYGDWKGDTIDSFNAYGSPGQIETVTPGDITTMDAIGWDAVAASPPPPPPPPPDPLADLTATSFTL